MSWENLEKLWDRADRKDKADGAKAYIRYHDLMRAIGDHYGVDVERTTAAFCALSPNNDYWGNLRSLVTMLDYFRRGLDLSGATVSTYKAARTRAAMYLNEDAVFLEHAQGLKTRAFYENISDPTKWGPVTVDGHMAAAYCDKPWTMKEAGPWLTRTRYRVVEGVIQDMAHDLRMLPHQVQATLWFARKRVRGVVYDPQMDLLTGTTEGQRVTFEPHHIPPYKRQPDTPLRPNPKHVAPETAALL